MGNKYLIKELKNAYDVNNRNKRKFIRTIKKPNISVFEFILNQFKLINTKVYLGCLAYLIILLVLLLSCANTKTYIILSASIPFFSLLLIYIVDASRVYTMEELEMATLYSLKMVVLARMLIMTVITILLILIVALSTSIINNVSLIKIVTCFFVPYFLNVYLNLLILKKYRNNGIKYCIAITFAICLFILYLVNNPILLVIDQYIYVGFALLLIVLSVNESKNYINGLEEYVWNLQ